MDDEKLQKNEFFRSGLTRHGYYAAQVSMWCKDEASFAIPLFSDAARAAIFMVAKADFTAEIERTEKEYSEL